MYKGHDVWQCPPERPGITMLVMLNILARFDLTKIRRRERSSGFTSGRKRRGPYMCATVHRRSQPCRC